MTDELAAAIYDEIVPGWRSARLVGRERRVLSPLRDEKNPSFDIHEDKLTWFDRGTGEGGGAIELASQYWRNEWQERVRAIEKQLNGDSGERLGSIHRRATHAEDETNANGRASSPDEVEVAGPVTLDQVRTLSKQKRLIVPDSIDELAELVLYQGREWIGFQTDGGSWKLWAIDSEGQEQQEKGKLKRRNVGPASIMTTPGLRSELPRLYDVEGESDLLAAHEAGLPAVCSTGGGSSTAGHDNARAVLSGLHIGEVIVVGDLDETGRSGAQKRAAWWSHLGIGVVRILSLPDELGPNGDVRDFLNGTADRDPMGTRTDIDALADGAPEFQPNEEGSEDPLGFATLIFTGPSLADMLERSDPPPVHPCIPVPGHYSLFVAPQFTGKTSLVAYLALSWAAGIAPWDGLPEIERGRTLILSRDESVEQVVRRIDQMSMTHPAGRPLRSNPDLLDWIDIIGPDPDADFDLLAELHFGNIDLIGNLITDAQERSEPYTNVFLDAYSDLLPPGAEENDNTAAARIGGSIEAVAVSTGTSMNALHHMSREGIKGATSGESFDPRLAGRGASAITAKARVVFAIAEAGPGILKVASRSNLGPVEPMQLRVAPPESDPEKHEVAFFRRHDPYAEHPIGNFLRIGDEVSSNADLARIIDGLTADERDENGKLVEPSSDARALASKLRPHWKREGSIEEIPGRGTGKGMRRVR